jgi:hypothetical protein
MKSGCFAAIALARRVSLLLRSSRNCETTMASHQGRLYHCGAVAPKRSTFADANCNRNFRVFSGLFEAMLAGASRGSAARWPMPCG